MAAAGRVWAHVGQPFTEQNFDVLIAGAGRMGAALALYLRQVAPQLRVLMVEEGGLPNEEGATILAPGLWTTLDLPAGHHAQAQWTRQQLQHHLGEVQFQPRPLLEFSPDPLPGSEDTLGVLARFPEVRELLDVAAFPYVRVDEQAATYRPGSVALNAAQQAIQLGAHLLLNTRVNLSPTGPTLARLTVTNTHQIITHEVLPVQAKITVVAAGAAGPGLIEHGLGVHTRHGRAYVQYPHLNVPSTNETPSLRVSGLTLRPQHGAFTLVPRLHHRDPHGYVPTGGHLTGVPTGLRREVLEDLVALIEQVPALGSEALQVGRSLSDLPGAWVALPHGQPLAPPQWQEVSPVHFLLLGGPQADTLGLAAAHELAHELARRFKV